MHSWIIAPIVALVLSFIVLVCVIRWRCFRRSPPPSQIETQRSPEFYAGLRRLKYSISAEQNPNPNSRRVNSEILGNGKGYSTKNFSWNDHPSLIAEAVEHGWATFAFTYTYQLPFTSRRFWDLCSGIVVEPVTGWEIGNGDDYMQKIRFNPTQPSKKATGLLAQVQCLQTLLPLPGPQLDCGSFPQEAYFEIIVIAEGREFAGPEASKKSMGEGELVKLIAQGTSSSDSAVKSASSKKSGGIVPERWMNSQSGGSASVSEGGPKVLSVGLAVGGSCLARLPGLEAGSVGFHSTGFVYLNGMAYAGGDNEQQQQSQKLAWGTVNNIVGCGYSPANRKIFYTLNGEKVCNLTCKSKDFSHPLYPTVAANYDVTVLINFGQSRFEYDPANAHRVPDPCFQKVKKLQTSPYEDSGDLFSIGKSDSQWFGQSGQCISQDLHTRSLTSEADSDLFEIVLDGAK
eukprot:TRINITY_DN20975_c0_g1_i1.p1 TRINITY_DN20975_c0_g1~~TRINITY_DN20975_c0_g1_i1.p1  ORF type:complete len:458 (-),score=32.28 TRINITY_DN20975_c0_g1_i1:172-1545(-)